MKIRMILMALAALLCLASCSDDDFGIQLTEDEVIGDIITGKQIVINTLTTYTDSANSTSKCKITKCFCKSTPLVLRNSISFLVSH